MRMAWCWLPLSLYVKVIWHHLCTELAMQQLAFSTELVMAKLMSAAIRLLLITMQDGLGS